jgi:hypothetical protein
MPLYLYLDERDDSVYELIQGMNEKHEAFAPDGQKLTRIWTKPQAAVSSISNINPFDAKQFTKVTGEKRGTVGDLMDLSKELSVKREEKLGEDPVAVAANEQYKKLHRGKDSPQFKKKKLKEKMKNHKLFDVDI